jgi:hypothetical protein
MRPLSLLPHVYVNTSKFLLGAKQIDRPDGLDREQVYVIFSGDCPL